MLEGAAPPESAGALMVSPPRDAVTCLAESRVRFCLLRDDWAALVTARDVDILVHPADRKVAEAALARAGFQPKRDRRLRHKWVYLRWSGDRFHVIDVHTAFVQGGIEYMSTRGALGRLDRSGPAPRLCAEDQFLHLLWHNVLGKGELQAKHLGWMRALRDRGLDAGRLADQARLFRMQEVLREALAGFESLAADPAGVRRLRKRARRMLLRRPANRLGDWRYRRGGRWRLGRRPVVLALLGPDGSGKTTFADALQAALHDSPLRPGRVYMGSWGHDLLPMRHLRRLVPPQRSDARLLLRRCGIEVELSTEEASLLAARPPSKGVLATSALRYAVKNTIFFAAIFGELGYRYLRHIAFSQRPLVLTDRYIYDLEFRQGKVPFSHGERIRRVLYRLFPAPDGILYLTTPYSLVEKRKPQLGREQFETMDHVFRTVLRPYHPLEVTSEGSPEDMVRAFLTRHWEQLLARCNTRA
jgi:thymidylate kinase